MTEPIDDAIAPLFSIIVPVYNSEDFVQEALESLLRQDFPDFEIIAIDDGSTDASGSLCDELAARDARLRVFHSANHGRCAARNFGIRQSRGRYIGFCDNDDQYLPETLSSLAAALEETPVDCICYGRRQERYAKDGTLRVTNESKPKADCTLIGDEIYDRYDLWCFSDGVWTRFYKRSIIVANAITFDVELKNGFEDCLFNAIAINHIHSVTYIARSFYIWRQRADHSNSMAFIENEAAIENKFLGFQHYIEQEHGNLLAHAMPKANPRLFATRLTAQGVYELLQTADRSSLGFTVECSVYRRLFAIYEPYWTEISACPLPPLVKVTFSLLMNRHWRQLYFLTVAGTKVKRLLRLPIDMMGSDD